MGLLKISSAALVCALCILMAHSCLAQSPDPPPPKPRDPTPQEWVDAHNAHRAPEGVVLMHWNESLAAYAGNYIKKIAPNCMHEHSGGPYGECLFQGDGAATAKEIVDYWASEKKYWDPKSKKCEEGQDCGHYLQVVNPNSPSLGCAKAKCGNDVWYHIDICSYTW
ncbi:pathogenesis-related protein 1A-like [Apium graveolens]|uniref:pathogenesis-related protein 1A-like n=1 Tax=Apium graveolens TaxID=4045 RepID=UPI003D7A6F37